MTAKIESAIGTGVEGVPKHVYLTGAPGSGKTRASESLAEQLGLPLVHVDELSQRVGDKDKSYATWEDIQDEIMSSYDDPTLFEGAQPLGLDQDDIKGDFRFVVMEAPRQELIDRIVARGYDDEEGVWHQGEGERENVEKKVDEALEALEQFKENVQGVESYDGLSKHAFSGMACGISPVHRMCKALQKWGTRLYMDDLTDEDHEVLRNGEYPWQSKHLRPVRFEEDEIAIRSRRGEQVPITVEVAVTPAQLARGLMHRDEVPQGRGMLFVFGEDGPKPFWMKDTHVPLDAAFCGPDGQIREIKPLEPGCIEEVKGEAVAVIEAPRGWMEESGIGEGCVVEVAHRRDERARRAAKQAAADQKNYRTLQKGEIVHEGDEIDGAPDGWNSDVEWRKVLAEEVGQSAPDPKMPSHRIFRRPVKTGR